MASLSSINVRFQADLKGFSTQMQNAERQLKKRGRSFEQLGKQFTLSVTAPVVAMSAVALKNWDAQEKAIAQVNAGLESTGSLVGFTSDELQKMASGLQDNSLFGDEEILQGATAQLLTFTNIAGEQFERTQLAALNLATRLDGDLKSASIQLGKALNDPVANLSALSRSGIQFSEDQKAMINSLVATNKLADAQTVILNELEKQYGGAAEAAAKAGLGPFKQLSNLIGDLSEDFGAIIGEALLPFAEKIKGIVIAFRELSPETKKTIAVVASLAATIGPLLAGLGFLMTTVVPGLISIWGVLNAAFLATPIGLVVAGAVAITAAMVLSRKEVDKNISSLSALNQARKDAASSTLQEVVQVRDLINTAKSEYLSKQKRLDAIKKLKQIAPSYFGDLTLETVKTDAVTTAVDNYILSLNRKAVAQAVQSQKEKLYAQIIELEQKSTDEAVKKNVEGFAAAFGEKNTLIQENIANFSELATASQDFSKEEITRLKNEIGELDKYIEKYGLLNGLKTDGEGGTDVKRPKAVGFSAESAGVHPIELLPGKLAEANIAISEEELKMQENAAVFNEGFNEIWSQTAVGFAENFGSLLGSMAAGNAGIGNFASFLLGTVADLAIRLGTMAIKIGLTIKGIKAALKTLDPVVAVVAGIALIALGTAVKSSMSNMSEGSGSSQVALASGGIAYKPTNALIGEYVGASTDPEVVAPLSKLKGMIKDVNGGGVREVPYVAATKVSGSDLKIILTRQNKLDSRTS